MKYEVNECCDCATETYPCIGDSCSLRHVTYYQCDRCGCNGLTEDEIHEVDGEDLCDTCFDEEFEDELKVLEQHEPNLCKAVKNIFHDSYEYTRQYRKFRKEMENK